MSTAGVHADFDSAKDIPLHRLLYALHDCIPCTRRRRFGYDVGRRENERVPPASWLSVDYHAPASA